MNQLELDNQLLESSKNGDMDAVIQLIQSGANVSHINKYGYTPLILASLSGHLGIVKYLVDHGADVNHIDIALNNSLIFASEKGHLVIVKYLVDHGADVNHTNNLGFTALIYASQNAYLDIVRYLVSHGANVNHKDNMGYTPLIYSALHGYWDIVKYLVDNNADYSSIQNAPFFRDIVGDQSDKLQNELKRYEVIKHIPNLPKDAILRTIYEVPYQQYCVPYGEGLPPIQLIALANILNNILPTKRGLIQEGGRFEPIDLHLSWKELCDKVKLALFLLL